MVRSNIINFMGRNEMNEMLLEKLLEVRESLDYVCEYEFPLNIFVRVDECIAILKGESDGIIN